MSKRAVEAVFQAEFLLTDIRFLFRETVPDHIMNEEQKEQAAKIMEKLKKQIFILETELGL